MQSKLNLYKNLLIEWQAKFNLVAPSTLSDIENRHFKDSEQLASILPANAPGALPVTVIDLGSGGGFPSVVLAIMGYNVVAIESIGKKARFLEHLKKELDLPNFTVVNDRVENYVKTLKKTGNSPYIFTARAFASLTKILDYVRPVKSRLFLLKGREIEAEVSDAKLYYDFEYTLYPSKTGDGFMINVENVRPKKGACFTSNSK